MALLLSLLLVPSIEVAMGQGDEDSEPLTCGSILKLQHASSGYRLHSHSVNYASGSRQQSVTGYAGAEDSNSFWIIRSSAAVPGGCVQGAELKAGDSVRLQHMSTRRFLHSHRHNAPLSPQLQEVSAFGDDSGELSDQGDDWVLESVSSPSGSRLTVDSKLRLRHVATDHYLSTSMQTFGHPIPGQMEIVAKASKGRDTVWKPAEGIFYPLV